VRIDAAVRAEDMFSILMGDARVGSIDCGGSVVATERSHNRNFCEVAPKRQRALRRCECRVGRRHAVMV
jgi:hypothetical protein